jgi:hypothetical protein
LQKAPSKDEINQLREWLETSKDSLPPTIVEILMRMLTVYSAFAQSASKAKQTLARLREAMGIARRSERGHGAGASPEGKDQQAMSLEDLSPEDRAKYEEMKRKRDQMRASSAGYDRKLKSLMSDSKSPEQLELDLTAASEQMFLEKASLDVNKAKEPKVERMKEFDREHGLHVTYDHTKRVSLDIVVTDIDYKIETVTDPRTGKSVRASLDDEGPEGFRVTWEAIVNLVKLHVGFAIPINRLSLIIGRPEFSSSKITRLLRWTAELLLPVYLYLAEELADSPIFTGDDTKTKVLTLDEADEGTLARRIEEEFGWTWPRADGNGDKKALNVSLLMGRSVQTDPRSTIRFFRTHLGSCGNLLTSLLERRSPKAGPVIFQGDLSTTNLPNRELMKKFDLVLAGCGAHARRPFWRWREEDPILCYFMLRGFLMLAQLEKRIDLKGRNRKNVNYMRGRFGRKIWQALYNRCVHATTGHCPGPYTLVKTTFNDVWPPGSDLHIACRYVITHFEELTRYLDNPYLQYTNNGSERALRIEKCMLSGSKFRKTRDGRAVLDILRTITATCVAAGMPFRDYVAYVFKHRGELQNTPEKFTPYAVALHFEKLRADKQA